MLVLQMRVSKHCILDRIDYIAVHPFEITHATSIVCSTVYILVTLGFGSELPWTVVVGA
jgi:hypothetical protein